ncbi:MAG: PAS domain S-box protein [Planctomycetota bacterium]
MPTNMAANLSVLADLGVAACFLVGIRALGPVVAATRRMEREMRQLLESAPTAMYLTDSEDRIRLVNAGAVTLFEYSRDALVGMDAVELVGEESREVYRAARTSFLNQPRPRVIGREDPFECRRQAGGCFPAEVSLSALDTGAGSYTINAIRDLTASRDAHAALEESEAVAKSLLNDVLDSSSVGISIITARHRVAWVNSSYESYFGVSRAEIVGYDCRRLVTERIRYMMENPMAFGEKVLAAYESGADIAHFECHILPEPGRRELWLDHWSQPIRSGYYAGGRIEHYTDITERKRADERIHLLARVARQMQIGLIIYRLENDEDPTSLRVASVNPEAEKLLSITAEESLGKRITEVFPKLEERGIPKLFAEVVRSGEVYAEDKFEYGDDNVDENIWSFKAFPLPDRCVGCVFERVTDQVRSEDLVKHLVAGASVSGDEFFHSIVAYLARSLDLDYAFVGEVTEDGQRIRTIAGYVDGKFSDNIEYELAGSPCEQVVTGGACVHASGVQARFPKDELLTEIQAESYIASPLWDSEGKVIGLINGLGRRPLANPSLGKTVLEIFASRASAELEARGVRG